MMRRLPPIVYLLTSLATLFESSVLFANETQLSLDENIRLSFLVLFAAEYFATPTLFLLAGVSSFWTNRKPRRVWWMAAAVLVVIATWNPFYVGPGWKFTLAAVWLVSLIFLLTELVRAPWAIAMIATACYGVFQVLGQDLLGRIEMDWTSGVPVSQLLGNVTPLVLVAVSLVAAIASGLAMQKGISLGHSPNS
jgi:hypothetical protein